MKTPRRHAPSIAAALLALAVPASPNRVLPALDKWQCWEFMIQANTDLDIADGKQAMWIDGKPIGEFNGIRWRNEFRPELKAEGWSLCTMEIEPAAGDADELRDHSP